MGAVYQRQPLGHWADNPDRSCARPGINPLIFFPTSGQHNVVTRAKRLCGICPVRQECLQDALDHPWLTGIWGGTTSRERTLIRKRRRAAS
jgi:hypothetical protein